MLEPDDTTPPTDSAPAADQAPAPPAKAAPRKRAPRKRAAAQDPDAEAAASSDPPAEPAPRKRPARKATKAAPQDPDATAGDTPPADAPAKASPRRRATRKSTAAEPAATEPATPEPATPEPATPEPATPEPATPEPATPEPALPEPATPEPAATDAAPAAPAKKAPRKRAAKKAAGAPAATEATPEAQPSGEAAPGLSGVLFQAPPVEPAPRRRRAAKKAAGPPPQAPPAEATAADETPAPVEQPVPADADIVAAEDVEDLTAEPEDVREVAAEQATGARRRRRRGRRGRGGGAKGAEAGTDQAGTDRAGTDRAGTEEAATEPADDEVAVEEAVEPAAEPAEEDAETTEEATSSSTRRRRRRRRSGSGDSGTSETDEAPAREKKSAATGDGVKGVKGSTRLEAKRQRRRDGRETTRRRAPILTEAEFLARREAVDRVMAVRQSGDRTQIAVLEDDVLVEHYVTRASSTSYVGNVYLGRVQNVLPSMEAAFVDIGKGRNGVLYAGEVNWDAAGLEGKSRTIEQALKSGDSVLVQVTKDPIGHKGARLTSQISLPGRFLVLVPGGGMTGISRRLPDTERHRLKSILKKIVPEDAGVIVRTAAEGASEEDLRHDVERLSAQWEAIQKKSKQTKAAPTLLHGEPDLATRVVRDVFNEDFKSLVVQGDDAWDTVSGYVADVAPDLRGRVSRHTKDTDLFADMRVDEQLMKALDRKVWLPSGGSLVIDRTEAMTVIDVNTGKFVGAGGNLEQTVTRNNLEAAEEIVRQLRLRDVGGIVVIDFIDMVLESNRDLVLRRLTECLGRDRTKHQVAEVTSLGLVQMTRKRVGEGLLEAFSEPCEICHGRGVIVHTEPVEHAEKPREPDGDKGKSKRRRGSKAAAEPVEPAATTEQREAANAAIAAIHRAAAVGKSDDEDGAVIGIVDKLASGLVAAAMDESGHGGTEAPEPAEAAEASEPSEATSETVPGKQAEGGADAEETQVPASRGRRRRRAASRPAGPPVAVGDAR